MADVWVMKLRPDGTIEWQKAYGGNYHDSSSSIRQTRDGGFILASATSSFGAGSADAWVLKLSPDGTVEWQKTYGGDYSDWVDSIWQTRDGGYIVAGGTESFGGGYADSWILKLRPDGDVEWQKTYGGDSSDSADSIQQTRDGGYIVAGSTESFGGVYNDAWVLKLMSNGTIEWQKIYGDFAYDWPNSILQTADDGYIVAGDTMSIGAEDIEFWILKLSSNGAVEWQKAYEVGLGGLANSIQQTVDGGYIVAGWVEVLHTKDDPVEDLLVMKLSPDGSIEWQKTSGGDNSDLADSIQQTSDGGYIVAGWAESFGAGRERVPELFVLKLRPDGSLGPSCDLITDTNLSVKDSTATVRDTGAGTSDTNVKPRNSSALVLDTNVPAHILCP
jgi:hypothetical protein